MKILISIIAFSGLLLANDISVESSQSLKNDSDSGKTAKTSQDFKDAQSKKTSTTKTKDTTKSTSFDVTRNANVEIIAKVRELEQKNVYPFNQCLVLTKPKLLSDFDIVSTGWRNKINDKKNDFIEKSAKNSAPITDVGGNEEAVKDYIHCISFYGAIVGQTMKTGKLDNDLTDKAIKKIYESSKPVLANSTCYFDKSSENILCGSLHLKIGSEPEVSFSNVIFFDKSNYFGYSGTEKKTLSYSNRLANEVASSRDRTASQGDSIDVSYNQKASQSADTSSKSSFSMKDWMKFN